MVQRVDRILVVVPDSVAATETFGSVLGAEPVREDSVESLRAHRTVLQAGDSEIELLRPTGPGPAADHLGAWGPGLFAAGFSVADPGAARARLADQGVRWTEEGEQIFIEREETRGLRVVLSPAVEREPCGHIRFIYEITHLVRSWKEGADRHTELFDLDPSRFCEITSAQFGYTGSLTLFDPPARLDRIEVVEVTDPASAMGRFFARRGESVYMCYCETDDTGALLERLRSRDARFTAPADDPAPPNLWVHPSAMCGVLLGVSRTNHAWTWSGHPELA
jgi:catechol 2,3-dioxygenase-like lactoylglutathione lyase family enzyme